jgi:hypothetical protein
MREREQGEKKTWERRISEKEGYERDREKGGER